VSDVNEKFYQDRSNMGSFEQMLESGMLAPARNGLYRFTTGPDRGELVSLDKAKRMVPVHNLDTSTGRAALAVREDVKTWHTLGEEIPKGMTDLDKILDLGGIGF